MKHSKKYLAVLRSARWKALSKYAIHMAGNKCQRCHTGTSGLVAHHLHYRTLGKERLCDVEVVCDACHPPADREREIRAANHALDRRFDAGYLTYMIKKYGEGFYEYPDSKREYYEWLQGRR